MTANPTPNMLTVVALQAALDRCMEAHPPSGHAHEMHPDANRMADLWASMVYTGCQAVDVSTVKPAIIEAYLRWSG